jgi:hypothetical protein
VRSVWWLASKLEIASALGESGRTGVNGAPAFPRATSVCTPILDALATWSFTYDNEFVLQDGVAIALRRADFDVEREVRLNARDRVDLLVGRIGIEVKVGGSPARVLAQLHRYARSERIDGLVLVTNQMRQRIPCEINGKPVERVLV